MPNEGYLTCFPMKLGNMVQRFNVATLIQTNSIKCHLFNINVGELEEAITLIIVYLHLFGTQRCMQSLAYGTYLWVRSAGSKAKCIIALVCFKQTFV